MLRNFIRIRRINLTLHNDNAGMSSAIFKSNTYIIASINSDKYSNYCGLTLLKGGGGGGPRQIFLEDQI